MVLAECKVCMILYSKAQNFYTCKQINEISALIQQVHAWRNKINVECNKTLRTHACKSGILAITIVFMQLVTYVYT